MRALWPDRGNCSHNVSQRFKRIRNVSGAFAISVGISAEFLDRILRQICLWIFQWICLETLSDSSSCKIKGQQDFLK